MEKHPKTRKVLEPGDPVRLVITDLTAEGNGIGKAEGLAVFVPGTLPGDEAEVKITKVRKNYALASVSALPRPSPDRRNQDCPYAGRCGGCALRELTYEAQLKIKEKQVRDRLIRIGGIEDPAVRPMVPAGRLFRYRNKARMPAGGRPVRIGFCPAGSREVTDCPDCLIQSRAAAAAAEALRAFMREEGVSAWNPDTGTGLIRRLIVKTAAGTGEVMAILVAAGEEIPRLRRLAEKMDLAVSAVSGKEEDGGSPAVPEAEGFFMKQDRHMTATIPAAGETAKKTPAGPASAAGRNTEPVAGRNRRNSGSGGERNGETDAERNSGSGAGRSIEFSLESLILNVNREKNGPELGEKWVTLAGRSVITDVLGGLTFEISPQAFYQVNPEQAEKLYRTALEYAALTGKETVLDLYCGVGTIGLFCAGKARRVIGVESVRGAVLDANRNAVLNGIVNAEFICGKAEDVVPGLLAGAFPRFGAVTPDVVLLDPPRAGCRPELLKTVADARPARIVYVSCDPATLARDVRILTESGYRFEEAAPVDLFPWTMGIETVALLSKLDVDKHTSVKIELDGID